MKEIRNPFKELPSQIGELHSNPIMRRYPGNPVVTCQDMPYPATFVFNAGVACYRGEYFMAPRVDLFNQERSAPALSIGTGFGRSRDGIHFSWEKDLIRVHYGEVILPWVCDARLTILEDELYLSFCFENQHSERPGIARWRGNGVDFDVVTLGIPQQRNMILWPEKINGLYMRLERPSNQWGDPFHIWYSRSPDLRYWGDSELLLGCEDVPFANRKIGGGAPPVRTPQGWLLFFHAVDDDPSRNFKMANGRIWRRRYTCGAALYDLEDPTHLCAITKSPLLVAEAPYETGNPELWVENTVFPCGAVLLEDGRTIRIYYGAGDCSTNIVESTVEEILDAMTPAERIADKAVVPFRIEEWKH